MKGQGTTSNSVPVTASASPWVRRRSPLFWPLLLLLCGAVSLAAQTPQTPPPAPVEEPGAGAQLRTGTSSGLETNPETSERLLNLLSDHQFTLLNSQLDALPADEAQFYRGLLANRENDTRRSIELLEPLVEKLAAGPDRAAEKLARKALAEDYLRSGDWTRAAAAYQTLNERLQKQLTADEREEIELPLKLLPLAQGAPPMTVEPCNPFSLQVFRDPLGLTDVPVFVDGMPHSWMLDPTAPFNLMARSTAREVGLKVSEESVTVTSLTGQPMEVHRALIPRFTIGGRLTLRNLTVFVFEDDDYSFERTRYRVEGVLGYPALAALGSLTVTDHATIEVRPARQVQEEEKAELLTTGARFYLDGDRVLVALRRQAGSGEIPPGEERVFAVDAAGQQTYLSSRYLSEHAAEFEGQPMQLFTPPGAEGVRPVPSYTAETLPLAIGNQTVEVHYVEVLTEPLGDAALDDVYGVLGMDVLDQLGSYTFDYRTMRFTARPRQN